jgi:hypothetical protein
MAFTTRISIAADEGVCIYLDGLSRHLHGNPETSEHDRRIRDWLRNKGYEVLEIAASDLYDEAAMLRHFRKLANYLSEPELRARLSTDTRWYHAPVLAAPSVSAPPERVPLRFVRPTAAQRYATCLPLIPLQAAAGAFGDPQRIPEDLEWEQWVAVDLGRKLRRGMFVAQVVGKSMEPPIPDGSYCVFAAPVGPQEGHQSVLFGTLGCVIFTEAVRRNDGLGSPSYPEIQHRQQRYGAKSNRPGDFR